MTIEMKTESAGEPALAQNLRDAGCEKSVVLKCAELYRENRKPEMLRLLTLHRAALLNYVHRGQDQLDCLDYLIHQMKK